jgi:DNA-binding NarL/FixJ family response regulator
VDKLVRLREASPLALTERQRELLFCLQEGLDNLGIARRTGLSVKTVENHLTRLYRHLGVQSRLEAVSYVHQHAATIGAGGAASQLFARESDRYAPRFVLMIVDDNVRYRTQLRRMIGKAYPAALILEAGGTQESLRLAHANPPQLALIDVVLGDESGIDCARTLHSTMPSVRVVLFSAYPDKEFHRQGIAAGAVAFLDKKDVDAAALRELIDDVIV